MLNLVHLEVLAAVARHGSVTEAARELHYSQPSAAATNELAAQVGLQTGRVRLAANASALSTIVPQATTTLAQAHPGLELSLIDRHPVEALQALRSGEIDVALIFRYADAPVEDDGFRLPTSAMTLSTSSANNPTTASRTIATPPGSAAAKGASRS